MCITPTFQLESDLSAILFLAIIYLAALVFLVSTSGSLCPSSDRIINLMSVVTQQKKIFKVDHTLIRGTSGVMSSAS